MNPKSILICLFLLLGMAFAVTAQEETGLSLIVLEDGEPVTNAFEDEVNAQLYAFYGSKGDLVTITMEESPDSTLDPYIVLMGAAGEVYGSDDDSGETLEAPFASKLENFELPSDGVYFVLATSFTGLRRPAFVPEGEEDPGPQFYEITVMGNVAPDELLDAEEFQFFFGELEIGQTNTLEITAEEPIFYVIFTAEEGETVTIFTGDDGSGPQLDTALHLFDSNGDRVAINDDGETRGLYSEIVFEVPQDGTYLVFATAYDFNDSYRSEWTSAGTFTLTIE